MFPIIREAHASIPPSFNICHGAWGGLKDGKIVHLSTRSLDTIVARVNLDKILKQAIERMPEWVQKGMDGDRSVMDLSDKPTGPRGGKLSFYEIVAQAKYKWNKLVEAVTLFLQRAEFDDIVKEFKAKGVSKEYIIRGIIHKRELTHVDNTYYFVPSFVTLMYSETKIEKCVSSCPQGTLAEILNKYAGVQK